MIQRGEFILNSHFYGHRLPPGWLGDASREANIYNYLQTCLRLPFYKFFLFNNLAINRNYSNIKAIC